MSFGDAFDNRPKPTPEVPDTDIQEMFASAVAEALKELREAQDGLFVQTVPHTPPPRPKIMDLGGGWRWSYTWGGIGRCCLSRYEGDDWREGAEVSVSVSSSPTGAVAKICRSLGWQPRKIRSFVLRLRQAAAWCRARVEGRRRAAREILRQQGRDLEALEAEAAIRSLAGR